MTSKYYNQTSILSDGEQKQFAYMAAPSGSDLLKLRPLTNQFGAKNVITLLNHEHKS